MNSAIHHTGRSNFQHNTQCLSPSMLALWALKFLVWVASLLFLSLLSLVYFLCSARERWCRQFRKFPTAPWNPFTTLPDLWVSWFVSFFHRHISCACTAQLLWSFQTPFVFRGCDTYNEKYNIYSFRLCFLITLGCTLISVPLFRILPLSSSIQPLLGLSEAAV